MAGISQFHRAPSLLTQPSIYMTNNTLPRNFNQKSEGKDARTETAKTVKRQKRKEDLFSESTTSTSPNPNSHPAIKINC